MIDDMTFDEWFDALKKKVKIIGHNHCVLSKMDKCKKEYEEIYKDFDQEQLIFMLKINDKNRVKVENSIEDFKKLIIDAYNLKKVKMKRLTVMRTISTFCSVSSHLADERKRFNEAFDLLLAEEKLKEVSEGIYISSGM